LRELLAEQPRIHALLLYTLYFQVLTATPLVTFIATLLQLLQIPTLLLLALGSALALLGVSPEVVVEVRPLAMTTTILLEQLNVTLVPELPLEHLGTITITILPILHVNAILEIQAEADHTLVVGIIITLVKHVLELLTLQITTTLYV
jgi:hypothetical protein